MVETSWPFSILLVQNQSMRLHNYLLKVLPNILWVLILCLGSSVYTYAQTNISGVVNHYASVTNLDKITNSVTLDSIQNFSVGDRVMLIQMNIISLVVNLCQQVTQYV